MTTYKNEKEGASQRVESVLSDINKSVIINAGRVYINGENSIWVIDHQSLGTDCQGRIYFVAQEEDDAFRSTGSSCSKCEKSIPELINISIARTTLEKKIKEDDLRERGFLL